MPNIASTSLGAENLKLAQNPCCGHRRSSSLPVDPINVRQDDQVKRVRGDEDIKDQNTVNLSGLVDTFTQISDSLSRPAKILLQILDKRNKNLENSSECNQAEEIDGPYVERQVEAALKQLSTIQGNVKHVLPHVEAIMSDYKTMKERTQSRDEMLKTLDKALRRSEGRNRSLISELQDLRDENKCLTEKAQQNESILRYLNQRKEDSGGEKRNKRGNEDGRDKGWIVRERGSSMKKRNGSAKESATRENGLLENNIGHCPTELTNGSEMISEGELPGRKEDLGAKLGHYQKVLGDYENQLQEVVKLNKELVLNINEREAEVMSLNRELAKHQETLEIYEKGFKNLTRGNSEMDVVLREEKRKNADLSEKLEDSEGYISCITDKVASYEVELKYLRQQLRKREEKTA